MEQSTTDVKTLVNLLEKTIAEKREFERAAQILLAQLIKVSRPHATTVQNVTIGL